jgi:hypothetical protein
LPRQAGQTLWKVAVMGTRALLVSTVVLVLVSAGSAACSAKGSIEIGTKVDSKTLEKQVTEKLQTQLPPDSVSCPDGLDAKVGAKSICTVIAQDLRYTATITATKVEGKTVSFDLKMPPPATVPKEALAKQVTSALADKVTGGVQSVTCLSDLVGTVGETAACDVTSGDGQKTPVTVTVTTATFTNVQFNIKPTA